MVVSLMIKILFLMGMGYLATKYGMIEEKGRHSLSELLVNVILPISMLASSQDEFSMENLRGLGLIGIIALVYYLLIFFMGAVIGRMFHMKYDLRVMGTLLIAFANTGFVGMPLVRELAGSTGMLYGVIYNVVFDLLYFSYGIFLLNGDGKGGSIKDMIKNPVIWVSVLSVVLYVLPFRLPMLITDCFEMVSNIMMPISMIVIGSQLYGMKLTDIIKNKVAYRISFIRMIVVPIITYILMYELKVEPQVAIVAILLSAMPSASLNVIFAEKYHKQPELAATTVMQNTFMMLVTLPLFMYLLQVFY